MTGKEILIHIFCSFTGTIGFAIIYSVPRKYYIGCGITGMAGWLTYLFVSLQSYVTTAAASFCGAFIVVLISRMLAVKLRCPITIFLIAGILPLVPGAGIYHTAYYIVTNRLATALITGIESLKVAFAIVMGIVIVVSIPRDAFHLVYWKKRRQEKMARKLEASK